MFFQHMGRSAGSTPTFPPTLASASRECGRATHVAPPRAVVETGQIQPENFGDFAITSRFVAAIAGFGLCVAAAGFAPSPNAAAQSVTVTDDTTTTVESTEDDAVIVIDAAVRTTGVGDHGVESTGANAEIDVREGATVEATGMEAFGIFANGENDEIRVDGTVETTGLSSSGIWVGPSSSEVPGGGEIPPRFMDTEIHIGRNGRVETSNQLSAGILSRVPSTVITVDGTIRTAAQGTTGLSHGIIFFGENSRVRVGRSGMIIVETAQAYGINVQGANADITVDGTIRVLGGAGGIRINTDDVRVRVGADGAIRTTAPGALGIGSVNDVSNVVVVVDGTIRTTGFRAHGVGVGEADDREVRNAKVRVGGMVETTGNGASGIRSTGANADIAVDGTIRTTGDAAEALRISYFSHGIHSRGADASIRVGGTIETSGASSSGIRSEGGNADIALSGTIRTAGTDAHGIHATGGGETITVSGGIHATGEGASAIFGEGGQTLRLLRGWSITGPITFEAGQMNRLELETAGNGISRTVRIPDLANVEIIPGGLLLRPDDDTFTILDPSASALQRATLANLARSVHGAVHGRDSLARPVPADSGSGGGFGDRRGWIAVIGGDFERGADGAALGWDGHLRGVVAGLEGRIGNGIRVGVLGGYARSDAATGPASVAADTDTGMLGVYGETGGDVGDGWGWSLTGALVGGRNDSETTRLVHDNLAGLQKASGSHDGLFASPSVGLRLVRPIGGKYEFRPSVRVDGLYVRHGSYTESGAGVSNVAYDSWTGSSADGRAQLGFAFLFGQSAEFEVRAGATTRLHGSEEVTVRPAGGGDRVTYDVPGDDSIQGGFVGGRLAWALRGGVSLVADGEYARASGDERSVTGRLKLAASF